MHVKSALLLCFLVLKTTLLCSQCPPRDSLWNRLVLYRDSDMSPLANSDQLSELLNYEKQITACSYKFDSTHALLLQRIGVVYARMQNDLKAIAVYQIVQCYNLFRAQTKRCQRNTSNKKLFYTLRYFMMQLTGFPRK